MTIAVAIATVAYLTPAMINGYPLVYWDTGGYLMAGVRDEYVPNRSAYYAWFAEITGFFSAWGVIAVQSAFSAAALATTVRMFFPGSIAATVWALVLGCFTSLPWYASWLMPDVFTGLAVLATLGLAFGHWPRWQTGALSVLLIFSLLSHTSHFPLVAATIAGAVIGALLFRVRIAWIPPVACLVAAVALTVFANAILTGQAFFNRTGWVLLFSRLAESGLVQEQLDQHCDDNPDWSKLCTYRDRIPENAEKWLWQRGTPFWRIGNWEGTREDSRRIVIDVIREHPVEAALFALDGFGKQLLYIELGEGTESQEWFLAWTIKASFPQEFGAWQRALQQSGRLLSVSEAANRIHLPIVLVALALTLIGLFSRRVTPPLRTGCFTVMIALLANAFVCGALSGPHDRYQVRLIWVVLATAVPVAVSIRRSR
ncbi:MAG: hypothetical protein U1F33_05280 [Alphaproteobacteria bacterium]